MKEDNIKIKDYRIIKQIGKGGMGKVYKAIHPGLKSNVIIKELIVKDKEIERRFKREAKIMMALRHDNIVPVFDYFIENNKKYIVMEYVHGVTLDEVIKKKGILNPHAAIFIFSQIACGLSYAHSKKVIHRDLKPNNILISENGEVRIIDFGISSYQDETGSFSKEFTTQTGIIIGTPAYMSPEQLNDIKDTTNVSDIYSLGVILYEMLSGKKPFGNSITTETVTARVNEKYSMVIDDDTKSIPNVIGNIITKSLKSNPAHRYKSIDIPLKKLRKYINRLSHAEIIENIANYVYKGSFTTSFSMVRPIYSSFFSSFKESKTRKKTLIASLVSFVTVGIIYLFLFSNAHYQIFQRGRVGLVEIEYHISIPKGLFPRNMWKWNKHRKKTEFILPDKEQSLGIYKKNVSSIKKSLYSFFDDNYRNMLYNFQLQAILINRKIVRGQVKDINIEEITLKPKNYIQMKNDDFEIILDDSGKLLKELILTSNSLYRNKGQYSLKIVLNNQSYWTHFSLNSLKEQDRARVVITNHKQTPRKTVSFNFKFLDDKSAAYLSDVKTFIWGGRKWRWINYETYTNDEKKLESLKNGRTYNFLFTHDDYKNEQLRLRVGRDQNVANITVRFKKKK